MINHFSSMSPNFMIHPQSQLCIVQLNYLTGYNYRSWIKSVCLHQAIDLYSPGLSLFLQHRKQLGVLGGMLALNSHLPIYASGGERRQSVSLKPWPNERNKIVNTTYRNIVGCNMLRAFGHHVATCWVLLAQI